MILPLSVDVSRLNEGRVEIKIVWHYHCADHRDSLKKFFPSTIRAPWNEDPLDQLTKLWLDIEELETKTGGHNTKNVLSVRPF